MERPASEGTADHGPSPAQETRDAPAGEPSIQAPALDEKARRRAEVDSFLGPGVQTPVGIPDGYTPTERSIHPLLQVQLENVSFEGPLDLLLYLIRRHDIDILDIPIAFVTDRYLEMLNAFEALEIDLAAEFLILAAELTHIKSKMLLPADIGVAVEDGLEDEDAGDPRVELVRRLLEYQKYRDAALQLADRDQLGRDVFPRVPPPLNESRELEPALKPVSVFRLVELMAGLLKRVPVQSHEISTESFSISERIHYVSAFGEARGGRFALSELLSGIPGRSELVATFIALLEMTKMGLLRIGIMVWDVETPETDASLVEDTVPTALAPSDSGGQRAGDELGGAHGDRQGEEEPVLDPESGGPVDAVVHEGGDVAAVQREAAALHALAEEAASEKGLQAEAAAPPSPSREDPVPLEPVPEIWIELTEKRFQGDLVDDYR